MRRSAKAAIDTQDATHEHDSSGIIKQHVPLQDHHNIFQTILESTLPQTEKAAERLGQEGFVAIAAGGETCARMMSNAVYYVLANNDRAVPMLAQELEEVMPSLDAQPELKKLEQLPYLVSPSPYVYRWLSILSFIIFELTRPERDHS